MKTLLAIAFSFVLVGCSSPGSRLNKTPTIVTVTEVLPDGTTITSQQSAAEAISLDLDGFAGELVVWDNWNKSVIAGSTKDEEIEDFTSNFTFNDEGTMLSAEISMGKKDTSSTLPTEAAWAGYTEAIRTALEQLVDITEAAASLYGPSIKIQTETIPLHSPDPELSPN